MSMKDKRRLNRNLTRKPQNSPALDTQLRAAYLEILKQLKPSNSESDRAARHTLSQEINKIDRRLNSGISDSDLSNLERVAKEEMARNRRLLNS